jgi:hypothetical protein
MQIRTAHSSACDASRAVDECLAALDVTDAGTLSWLHVFHTEAYPAEVVRARLVWKRDGVPLHGGTTCAGVMTERGFHGNNGRAMGMFAISDPAGSYGIGAVRIGADPSAASASALEAALADAGRPGEVPMLVWMNAAPGCEERLIEGIEAVIGRDVPIAGGSTADNGVHGHWRQMTRDGVFGDAVVISVFFPSVEIACAFQSGYDSTDHAGRVTAASGRTLQEIDHRPAAAVYDEWTSGTISGALVQGGTVLAETSLFPLGRELGQVGGVAFFKLSHPEQVTAEGGLRLFTDIAEGEEIVLMTGSRDSLISRAGRVVRAAIAAGGFDAEHIAGALVIYCAGCMLTVREDMAKVAGEVGLALGGSPFLGIYTFGEQGCAVTRDNSHGNLMISVVVFGDRPAR